MDAPFLRISEERRISEDSRITHHSAILADDAAINGFRLAKAHRRTLQHQMIWQFDRQQVPLPLKPEMLQLKEGCQVLEMEGNNATVQLADGSILKYAFSYLPRNTEIHYIGESRDGWLQIFCFESEPGHTATAIGPTAEALNNFYELNHGDSRRQFLALGTICTLLFGMMFGMALFLSRG